MKKYSHNKQFNANLIKGRSIFKYLKDEIQIYWQIKQLREWQIKIFERESGLTFILFTLVRSETRLFAM